MFRIYKKNGKIEKQELKNYLLKFCKPYMLDNDILLGSTFIHNESYYVIQVIAPIILKTKKEKNYNFYGSLMIGMQKGLKEDYDLTDSTSSSIVPLLQERLKRPLPLAISKVGKTQEMYKEKKTIVKMSLENFKENFKDLKTFTIFDSEKHLITDWQVIYDSFKEAFKEIENEKDANFNHDEETSDYSIKPNYLKLAVDSLNI